MTHHWQRTLELIVRRLKPSAESFAAAAAVYSPGLMLQLKITERAVGGPISVEPYLSYLEHKLTDAYG